MDQWPGGRQDFDLTTIVIFRCGEKRCAIERAAVAEVAPLPELSCPPGMPANLEGFLNRAGEAVPVVDAARLFGVEPSADIASIYRHVLILSGAGGTTGLLVDRVEDVRTIDPNAIRPASASDSLNGTVSGEIDMAGAALHLLAADRILLAAEKARLAELRRAEQTRLDALATQ